jgi:sigma-B regulation protein RsbU (phosphoserine phosphatase)
MRYINAGHNNPILRRASGVVERLSVGGLPLGIRQEAVYETAALTLGEGDWLTIFTDGLVEAQNQFADEYGEPRLLAVLEAGASLPPDQMLQRMIAAVNQFVGTTPQHDDITCMLLKVVPL